MRTISNFGRAIYFFSFLSFCNPSYSQLSLDTNVTANQLVQGLFNNGFYAGNIVLSCHGGAYGVFSGGATTNLGIDSGIILSTGAAWKTGLPADTLSNTAWLNPGDNDLSTYGVTAVLTKDACKLEFDMVPSDDSIYFSFVFGAEEYPEWCSPTNTSPYSDAFAFFISGPGLPLGTNIAKIPVVNTPININTINQGQYACPDTSTGCTNCAYYIDNCTGTSIVYDGFTTVLNAQTQVQSGSTYHIKLVIADGTDLSWDSGVFIKKGTLSGLPLSINSNKILGGANVYFSNSDNRINIRIPEYSKNEHVQISLYDLLGRKILFREVNSESSSFELNEQPPGIYFYVLNYSKGIATSGKFLKQ